MAELSEDSQSLFHLFLWEGVKIQIKIFIVFKPIFSSVEMLFYSWKKEKEYEKKHPDNNGQGLDQRLAWKIKISHVWNMNSSC